MTDLMFIGWRWSTLPIHIVSQKNCPGFDDTFAINGCGQLNPFRLTLPRETASEALMTVPVFST